MKKMHVILEIPERKTNAGPASCEYCFFNYTTSYPQNYPYAAISDKRTYGGCYGINTCCDHIKQFTAGFPAGLNFCSRFDTNDVRVKSIYLTDIDDAGPDAGPR